MFTLVVQGEPVCIAQDDKITSESAVVEEILPAYYESYRYLDYIVEWHGKRVVVDNPRAGSRHAVGDTIDMAVWHRNVAGDRVLQFANFEQHVPRPNDEVPTTDRHESLTDKGTGTVEEVLSVDDESYHFVAYIVKWHDYRIAIAGGAQAVFAAGDTIQFAILGMTTAHGRGLSLFPLPKQAQRPTDKTVKSKEHGVIERVLAAKEAAGYNYRAYVVKWRGGYVVLQDLSASLHGSAPLHAAGESIPFLSVRHTAIDGRIIADVGLDSGEHYVNPPSTSSLSKTSMTTEVSTVEEVIEAKEDGIRYVSYLINWNGNPVAVNDHSATTHYALGSQISFTVTRNSIPAGLRISFDIFDAPSTQLPRLNCER
jgi:hypothetical protein